MKTQVDVLLHSVVVGRGFPVLGEEHHAHCLAEVVELQTGATDSGHDRCVGDDLAFDAEFASPEDQICVRSRSDDLSDPTSYQCSRRNECIPERIADDQECDVGLVGVCEDLIAATLD